MSDARELELGVLAPLAPYFARKVANNQPTLVKYEDAEAEYADITRAPSANLATVIMRYDVPVSVRKASFKLDNLVVTVPAADDFEGVPFVALPDRNIAIIGAELTGTVVFSGDYATNDDPTIGVGTSDASNVSLSGTMQNIIPATTFTNITAGASNAIGVSMQATAATLVAVHVPDGASTVLYLNVGNGGDVLSSDGTATFNGTFDLYYIDLGNRSS